MEDKTEEALRLLEEKCQDVFRFGDKHLPEPIRGELNHLWLRVLEEQQRRAAAKRGAVASSGSRIFPGNAR